MLYLCWIMYFFVMLTFNIYFFIIVLQDSQHVTSGLNGSKEYFASSCHILAHAKFNIKQY